MVTGRDLEIGASWKDRIERFRLVCIYIYTYLGNHRSIQSLLLLSFDFVRRYVNTDAMSRASLFSFYSRRI